MINSYDREEFKVVKNKRYNEMIISAKGDVGIAQKYFNMEFPQKTTFSMDELLFEWAFQDDSKQVDITVKKFSLLYLKKWLGKGFYEFAEQYRKKEKPKYSIAIDGWKRECAEDSYPEASAELVKYYNKNRVHDTLVDKYIKIFIGMAAASLLFLLITAWKFNKITLIIGILLGVVSGFLLWRRISDMQSILRAKRENGCRILKKALEELKAWRMLYHLEDDKNKDLVNVFENMEI